MSQLAMVACSFGVGIIVPGNRWLLIFAPLLVGLGYGLITPAGSQISVAGPKPRFMGLVFSAEQTGVPLGGLFAGLLIPLLIERADWRFAILCIIDLPQREDR